MSKWIHMSGANAPRDSDREVLVMRADGSTATGLVSMFNWFDETKADQVAKFRFLDAPPPSIPTFDTHEALTFHTLPGGTKHDQGKPQMDLLDPYAIEQLAKVLTFGATKYAAHNWRKGIHKSRLLAAAMRHLFAYLGGQDKDPETGLPHVAHAMCCCMFLLGLENRPELDDRYKP